MCLHLEQSRQSCTVPHRVASNAVLLLQSSSCGHGHFAGSDSAKDGERKEETNDSELMPE